MIIDREFISHAIIGQNVLTVEHNAHYVGGSSVRYDEAASPHHEPVIFRANCSIQPSSLEYRGFNPVVQFSGYQEINWYECLIFEIRGTLDLGNWSHLLEAISLYVDAILPLGLLAKCEKQRNRDKKSRLLRNYCQYMDKMVKFSKLTTELATSFTTGVNLLINNVPWLKKITLQRGLAAAFLWIIIYVIVQQRLRYARMRYLMRKYPFRSRESYRFMTDQQAFEIQKTILQLEFPFMALKSLQFALFRVSFLVDCVAVPLPAIVLQAKETTRHTEFLPYRLF